MLCSINSYLISSTNRTLDKKMFFLLLPKHQYCLNTPISHTIHKYTIDSMQVIKIEYPMWDFVASRAF